MPLPLTAKEREVLSVVLTLLLLGLVGMLLLHDEDPSAAIPPDPSASAPAHASTARQ